MRRLLRPLAALAIVSVIGPGIVEAAHLSPYASDPKNRANPSNGVCLCKYCHRTLDLRLIAIQPNGELMVAPQIRDAIALHHFGQISKEQRKEWLMGVDSTFLELTVKWYMENLSNNTPQRTSTAHERLSS